MKISVLIPTYGRPDYLEQALASVAGQKRQPDEVVVSDNHPGISCAPVVEKFREKLPIRRVQPAQSLPMDAHWLWAFRQPTGDYVALLEDDNLWRPAHLLELEQAAKQFPQATILGTCGRNFTELRAQVHTDWFAPPFLTDLLSEEPVFVEPRACLAVALGCNLFISSGVMFQRKVADRVLPRTSDVQNARDCYFWAALAAEGGAAFAPKMTVLYRVHPEQAVQQIAKKRYRSDSALYIRALIKLISEKGWTVPEVCHCAEKYLAPTEISNLGIRCVRTRDKQLIKELIPQIPRGKNQNKLFAIIALEKFENAINFLKNKL